MKLSVEETTNQGGIDVFMFVVQTLPFSLWSSSDDLDSLLLLRGFDSDSDSWLSEGFDSTIVFPILLTAFA